MKSIAALCSLGLLLAAAPATGANCEKSFERRLWNTEEFFKTATPKAVIACLQAGADLSMRDKDGLTSLHRAAASNPNPAVITALLHAGAGVNARTKNGNTPLHGAT